MMQNQTVTQSIPMPDQKPKWKQTSFMAIIVGPLISFTVILIAAKYPGLADAIKKSGLDNAFAIALGGSAFTTAAYVHGEKSKDGKVLAAAVTAENQNPTTDNSNSGITDMENAG